VRWRWGILDAIDAYPWVGTQLSREPLRPAVLRIWAGIGSPLQSLGVTGVARSDAGSALVNYVLGAVAPYAVGSCGRGVAAVGAVPAGRSIVAKCIRHTVDT
jgi:hypothetical protein